MTFKINLAPLLGHVVTDAGSVQAVADKTLTYIQVAEQMGKALGLSGPDKASLVKAALLADIAAWNADLAKALSDDWNKMAGIISAVIAVFNWMKWAFAAVAPIIEVAAPDSIPAITAINAAAAAITALGNAQAAQAAH